ncbi:MAG TPA: Nramp family divalent metal transporter [Alphaproteobacteria bacterium]|nr:Nramp family divalent metal transporter [Alphaproteobacteria bacterium]
MSEEVNTTPPPKPRSIWSKLPRVLGPGLITGASDDDPSGIATYSQAGARFGYALGWTIVFTYPLMTAVQMISARIGRTTGHGIAGNLRRHYPNWLVLSTVTLLLVANIINIGADLGAMADATRLVIGGPAGIYLVAFAVICAVVPVFMDYRRYVAVLKWLTLALLAYIATLVLVDVEWSAALYRMAVPQIAWDKDSWAMVVAIFGTTISPYLFFWQAEQEAEDTKVDAALQPLNDAPAQGPDALQRIELDTIIGMGASNIVALAIVLATAATLHAAGTTEIETSAQAAEALRPIAGPYAATLFALGIAGTGLLAVPVLGSSAAYAIGEALHWRVGLARKPKKAKAFYGTLVVATLLGAVLNFSPIPPMTALYWAAVLNGIVAVPVLVIMMLLSARQDVMGGFVVRGPLKCLGWLTAFLMAASVVALVVTSV